MIRVFAVTTVLFSIISTFSLANTCYEDKAPENLPRKIGRPGYLAGQPTFLMCDTVFVREGDTTIIYPEVRFGFSPKAKSRVIKVEGTLITKGTRENKVTLAGTLMDLGFGLNPSPDEWGGIEVGLTGHLYLTGVTIYNAPTAIKSVSQNVYLENVYLYGCKSIVGPRTNMDLDGSITKIESMDFTVVPIARSIVTAPDTAKTLISQLAPKQSNHTGLIIGSIVGATLIGGGGFIAYTMLCCNDPKIEPSEDNIPKLPTFGNPKR
jgi:hypothetical protein